MIPDTHLHQPAWGIRPVLFEIAGRPVPSYAFFVGLGLVAAVALYYWNTSGRGTSRGGLYVALAAAVGGILGSKLPIWIAALPELIRDPNPASLLSGRTIVGGLVGGALAVWVTKKRLGITRRLGNFLVPSLCVGVFFGRVGCLLSGCCYGSATSLPWGVDFGDHVARHPAQLYEALFVLALFVYAQVMLDRYEPGMLFRHFMVAYFGWRFAIEFIRANPIAVAGLTYYQVTALAVVLFYLAKSAVGIRERSLA